MTGKIDTGRDAYRAFYDGGLTAVLSAAWGGNLHLGFFERPGQTLAEAQLNTKRHLAKTAGLRRGSTVIEVACGVGGSARFLAQECDAQVLATNIAETQLDEGRRAAAAEGLGDRVRFAFADYHDLSALAENASFDCWWCQEALLYAADKPRVLREARRVVKAGGRLVMTDLLLTGMASPDERVALRRDIRAPEMITIEEWDAIIAGQGFEVVAREDWRKHAGPTFEAVLASLMARRVELVAIAGEELVAGTEFRVTRQRDAARAGNLGWGCWVLQV